MQEQEFQGRSGYYYAYCGYIANDDFITRMKIRDESRAAKCRGLMYKMSRGFQQLITSPNFFCITLV